MRNIFYLKYIVWWNWVYKKKKIKNFDKISFSFIFVLSIKFNQRAKLNLNKDKIDVGSNLAKSFRTQFVGIVKQQVLNKLNSNIKEGEK